MRAPQTGRWMRLKAQTEGGIAALCRRYHAKAARALPCIRRGRCSHRPGNPAISQTPSGGRDRPPYIAAASGYHPVSASRPPYLPAGSSRIVPETIGPYAEGSAPRLSTARHACCPRLCRLFTLHCRAGVHARREGLALARKDIGGARRRTPQSADADSSPCRGVFRAAVFPKPSLEGEVDAPQGADGGVHCRLAPQVSCKLWQGLAPMFRRG